MAPPDGRRGATLRMCLLALLSGFRSRPPHIVAAGPPADQRHRPPPNQRDSVQQTIEYIWPVTLFSFPLFTTGDALLERVASVAEQGYKQYLQETLPKELAIDPVFRKEFEAAESSRYSLAFLRWQKRVFSLRARVPVEELNWDGKPVPKYQGVSYEWQELYEDANFKTLLRKIEPMIHTYMKQMSDGYRKEKLRIFVWAEPYRTGDFQRPHEHTGAMCSGVFTARYSENEEGYGQRIVFQDPRGHFAPFGRRHEYTPVEGEVVMWPSWAPHYVEPQPSNRTNIFFSFLAWPPGGAPDLDWEDDLTGDIVYKKATAVRRGPQADPAAQRTEL